MEKDLNDSVVHNSFLNESESDKSFVGKVKSIISNTPLSKWFRKQDDSRPVVRRRDEVFGDEDLSEIQPPSKRLRLPPDNEANKYNNVLFKETDVSATNVSKNVFYKVPEPVAGPSGIKSHKLLNSSTSVLANCARNTYSSNELLNGHSDSEESTSGYSSVARIGSKEQVCESQESSKQASPDQTSPSNSRSLFHKSSVRPNRSLFADRSFSPNMNTSLSSRRPNFNASTFGSPNFVDKTISTRKILDSPFYNGKTIYGGASAYGRSLGRTSRDLKTSLRNSVEIKPVNKTPENANLVLGKTARRILDTIEQYGSPISDAKKIPIVSRKARQDGLITKYTGANPYIVRETKGPPTKELQVPTVSDLLRMKTRLQESTETVRQLAATSKSDLNTEYYKIPTKENEKGKHTGKIKAKVTSVRPKHAIEETASEVNLPPVSLPITTLPKFDFVIPPPQQTNKKAFGSPQNKPTQQKNTKSTTQTPVKTIQTELNVQIEKKTTTSTIVEYKFSEPLVVAENMKSLVAINNFKFSEPPTCTKNKFDASKNVALNFKMPEYKPPNLVPNKKTTDLSVITAKTLKTGSVMDILGKKKEENSLLDKFKPAQGTWECPTCMIRNQPDKTRCVACESPKTQPTKPSEPKNLFGAQFKLSSDKWECGTCLVRNNNSDNKCVSCTTPKPGSVPENKPVPSIATGFGDKFKPTNDTWECNVCMIRNKKELTKCAACETPNAKSTPTGALNVSKPSNGIADKQTGFGMAFKPKQDEWECGTCMVRNKESNTKCQCCETPNPKSVLSTKPIVGVATERKPISSFNFGIDKAAATSFSFGIPSTATVSLSNVNTQATSIFGGNSKPPTSVSSSFSFGIPAAAQNETKTAETALEPIKEAPKPNVAVPAPATTNPLLKPQEKAPEKATEFKFGANTSGVVQDKKDADNAKADASKSTPNKASLFSVKPAATNGEVPSLFGKPETTVTATPAVTNAAVFAFATKPAAVAAPLIPPSTQSSQAEPAKPMFKFGSNSGTTAPNVTFNPGNSAATTLNNGFGSTTAPSFGMSGASNFDKPPASSTEAKPFTFSSATAKDAAEPASKVPMFSFGQSAPTVAATTATSKPGFNFGSTTAPSFNFTGGKMEAPAFNAAPSGNIFGAAASTGGQNGTFNFGNMASSNNSQKAGFSFGGAVNNAAGAGSQSGFNFGGSAATFTPSTGGFNFSGAAPAFNASAKPSFNFTDGSVAAFSAQPAAEGGMAAPRKIKRAVRRTQR